MHRSRARALSAPATATTSPSSHSSTSPATFRDGQEHAGIISHGAKLVYAYAEANRTESQLHSPAGLRGAYIAMGSKHLGGDINLSWPTSAIAVTGPDVAATIVFRNQIERSDDPALRAPASCRTMRSGSPTPTSRPRAAISTKLSTRATRGQGLFAPSKCYGIRQSGHRQEARQYPSVTVQAAVPVAGSGNQKMLRTGDQLWT